MAATRARGGAELGADNAFAFQGALAAELLCVSNLDFTFTDINVDELRRPPGNHQRVHARGF